MASLILALATLLAGVISATAQVAGRARTAGVLKMAAASGYIGFALVLGAAATPYGRWILTALALSWLGDLFLIGHARRLFTAGLGAFLLAHIAFAGAFALRGAAPEATALGAVAMAVVDVLVFGWLLSAGLPRAMLAPVGLYLLAIGAMVALAAGTFGVGGDARRAILVGAVAFALSDVFVARERFVVKSPINRLVGLPLYFAAQLLLATSVATVAG